MSGPDDAKSGATGQFNPAVGWPESARADNSPLGLSKHFGDRAMIRWHDIRERELEQLQPLDVQMAQLETSLAIYHLLRHQYE